jgi:hypothetical protein
MSSRRVDDVGDQEGARFPACARRRRDLLGMVGIRGAWLVLGVALASGLGCASALGATGHGFLSSLSEAPLGTALKEPGAVAVDQADGTVFVADPGSGMVDVFSASGAFVAQFGEGQLPAAGVAVDEASGYVYVADTFQNAVLVFKPNGSGGYRLLSEWFGASVPGGEFGEVAGVAVDNSKGVSAGDVYVVDRESPVVEAGVVDVLKPKPVGPEEAAEGEYVRSLASAKMVAPNGVAVSRASGGVFVADSAKGAVLEFGASGTFESQLTGASSPQGSFRGKEEEEGNVTGVAIDGATGNLFVAEAQRRVVSEFNAAGEWVGWVTTAAGPLVEPDGVALAPGGGVYVADAGTSLVDVFGPDVVVPDAKTNPASKLTKVTASLNGAVNGDGKPAKYHFQWGTTTAYGSSTPTTSSGAGEEKISAALASLHAGTAYHFRLVVENENGVNVGIDREFTTVAAVEALSTGPVQGVKPTEATLTGSLTPNGVDAHYYFEWGLTASYGNTSPALPGTDAGSGSAPVPANTVLTGLTANTTYHYRLVGTNSFGTTAGEDAKFTTSGPPRITSEPTTGIGHETATINARVNPDELASEYHFEYGESTSYGTEVPLGGGKLPAGETPQPITAALSKLKLGVTYHFRVVAKNEAGTTTGPDQTFTTIPPALIESESAAEVSATGATLQTQVNPLGHDTTYYFQYGTEPCKPNPAGCTSTPAPPGTDIGSGETGVPGSVRLQELKPASTYHYRVLAINTLGTSEGPEHTLTTQPTSTPFALADNRAWELVTPPDKHGAPVEALTREGGLILASEDGNALTYVADGTVTEEAQGNRSPEMQQYLATRTPEGWATQDIATPNTIPQGVSPGAAPEYQFFTPDLALALVEPWGNGARPPLAPGVTQKTMYLRDNATGTYLPLVTNANVAPGTEFGAQIHFVSATPDLSHVVIASKVALTGLSSAPGLYEWTGGSLQLVSVLPGGGPAKGLVELGYANVTANAISTDGSRTVWTTAESERSGHLYMRDAARGQTVQLDAAQGISEPSGTGTAHFQAASRDGSRVFFTDQQRLTPDSTAEPLPPRPDLYECEMVVENSKLACKLTDLTVDHNSGEHANVPGLLFGVSEDGTSVYLVAQGVLASNENGNGENAVNGKDNLYELHYDGKQWTTRFIAMLSSEDSPEWEGNRTADSAFLTARVSPSGRYLAFMSAASPTGYDNLDQHSGKRDQEVYLYDSHAASLTCISCNPSGARPVGVLDTNESGEGLGLLADRRKVWVGHWLAGSIPGWTAQSLVSAVIQSRYLSDSGRLFFNSPDSLVPQATNHKENVYEYEPAGLGSCESPTGGCVSLISSGSSGKESAFLEATPSGDNVFLITEAQLLPQDTDTAFDIYDARVCTSGSPCLTPPVPAAPGCSTANACRPTAPGVQAPLGSSGTATFSGSGNIQQPKAEVKGAKTTVKPLTRAQKLAKALKACKKQHSTKKRKACEAHARKLYGHAAKARKTSSGRPGRRTR